MVSNVRYRSFKDIDLKGKIRFGIVLSIVLVFVFISIAPPLMLFLMALLYAGSGPLLTLVSLRKRRLARQAADSD